MGSEHDQKIQVGMIVRDFKGVLGLSLGWGGQNASGGTEWMKQEGVSREQIAVRWGKANKEY